MIFSSCSKRPAPLLLLLLLTACWSRAQDNNILAIAAPERLTIQRGAAAEVKLKAELRPGFHVNSNTPSDEFLIPLRLTWTTQPLQTEQVIFPKPQMEQYKFSTKPLSVFSGTFEIVTRFRAPATAQPGLTVVAGKVRYQACNDRECFQPRTAEVHLTVDVR